MSATIYWRPFNNSKILEGIGAPSSFIEDMKKAFDRFPLKLTEDDIPTLKGMIAVDDQGYYQQVLDLIEKYEEIELYAEY